MPRPGLQSFFETLAKDFQLIIVTSASKQVELGLPAPFYSCCIERD